jgi:hypothetical protein
MDGTLIDSTAGVVRAWENLRLTYPTLDVHSILSCKLPTSSPPSDPRSDGHKPRTVSGRSTASRNTLGSRTLKNYKFVLCSGFSHYL